MSETRNVWQIAGGPWDRPYAHKLVQYGVGLIGPGWAGPWQPGMLDDDFEGGAVRRFAQDAEIGDIVVLRQGQTRVVAVGIIAGEYEFLPQFDDVNG